MGKGIFTPLYTDSQNKEIDEVVISYAGKVVPSEVLELLLETVNDLGKNTGTEYFRRTPSAIRSAVWSRSQKLNKGLPLHLRKGGVKKKKRKVPHTIKRSFPQQTELTLVKKKLTPIGHPDDPDALQNALDRVMVEANAIRKSRAEIMDEYQRLKTFYTNLMAENNTLREAFALLQRKTG